VLAREDTVAVISPGAMGSGLATALADGVRVVATLAGRSSRTEALARASGRIELLDGLDAVVAEAGTVLTVVPPAEARALAQELAAACRRTGASPLMADLNAVSPETVQAIAGDLAGADVELVDGSISGPPPSADRPGSTRLYLAGRRAREVAELFGAAVDVRVLGPSVGAASALKMCTASIYKGVSALSMQALLAAREHGLVDEVLADLAHGLPELAAGLPRSVALAAAKSERYVAEMREIAAAQAAAGLTPALFEAIAEVFAAAAASRLAAETPESVPGEVDLAAVLAELAARRGPERST
jgi:3-hydroxyisobutyrate dehydrogenase-like beta-hydroxyacid dehydrogenase